LVLSALSELRGGGMTDEPSNVQIIRADRGWIRGEVGRVDLPPTFKINRHDDDAPIPARGARPSPREDAVVRELRGIRETLGKLLTCGGGLALNGVMSHAVSLPAGVPVAPVPMVPRPSTIADAGRLYADGMDACETYRLQFVKLAIRVQEKTGVSTLTAVTTGTIETFLSVLRKEGRSGATLRNNLCALNAFFDWCVRMKYIPESPSAPIPLPRKVSTKQRAFTAREVMALIRVAPPERARLYRFLATTGVRISEAHACLWGWLDLESTPPTLTVPAIERSKRRADRVLALDPETASILRVVQNPDPQAKVFEWTHDRKLERDMNAAGISEKDPLGRAVAFNGFRRFAPSALAKAGVSPEVARQRLGHTSVATTLKHYTDAGLTEQSTAASVLSDAIYERGQDFSENFSCNTPARGDTGGAKMNHLTPNHGLSTPERPAGSSSQITAGRQGSNGPVSAESFLDTAPAAIAGVGFEPTAGLPSPSEVVGLLHRVLGILERLGSTKGADHAAPL